MIPPQVIRGQILALRCFAPLVVRGRMTRDDAIAQVLPTALEIIRKTMPDYSEQGMRTQLAWHLTDFQAAHARAYDRTENEIRWAIRAMIRGPQAPTDDDPQGSRRPTSAELLAAAAAINGRNGAPLSETKLRFGRNEVAAIVEEEVLTALRRASRRKAA